MSMVGRSLTVILAILTLALASAVGWLVLLGGTLAMAREGLQLSVTLTMDNTARLVALAVLLLTALIALGALWMALRRPARPRLIELHAGDHESVLIAPAELERQLEAVARDTERVSAARAAVQPAGDRSVTVDMALDVEPDAELGTVVADVQQRMATALAARYGIALNRKPRIQVRYAGDRDTRRREHTQAAAPRIER